MDFPHLDTRIASVSALCPAFLVKDRRPEMPPQAAGLPPIGLPRGAAYAG